MGDPEYFKRWYEKNKKKLSKRRKKKYAKDSEYRNTAIKRSRDYRTKKRVPEPKDHLTFYAAAAEVGVSEFILREWKRRGYFPEPLTSHGRLWFSLSQVKMLGQLREFFRGHGVKSRPETRGKLEDLVGWIQENW